eukprot:CAMPEP_0115645414 /NCGR_PEP_ID=MMETSP0272-20121206/38390_1 /TAXON_ID=71861 /ORGANISM="Scrippsiella trochoidea, Strain CCMP3099" /LENGTH=115 /DNA_ID=CAMNT_0003082885 /DNA_START=120 /DNA_END=465 /DNA_ORIENTATION=-
MSSYCLTSPSPIPVARRAVVVRPGLRRRRRLQDFAGPDHQSHEYQDAKGGESNHADDELRLALRTTATNFDDVELALAVADEPVGDLLHVAALAAAHIRHDRLCIVSSEARRRAA